ncbi:MAG: dihydroorotase [Thermoanaerobaculales bacterium]|nr:dihydroorotase [Thermoanaerobaculales bacterium]
MTRLLIRNGRVVDPSQGIDQGMDLLIDDGLVAALGEKLDVAADTPVFDASGLVVAPGFIDIHTHLREPGFEYKETIESGCRAAAAGGFTAVCALANTSPVNDEPAVTRYVIEKAGEVSATRIYPVGALSKGCNGEELAEIGKMIEAGAVAISDSPNPVANGLLMRRALEYCRSFDVPVMVHPEDLELTDRGAMHEGRVSTRIGLRGMPGAAEQGVVARDILLAELTRGRLHLCHLSTAASLEMVRIAKRRGLKITCEVTPHHFTLIDEDIAKANYDPQWKMNPPLRGTKDRQAVLEAIQDGTVDAIVSDHAPHHQDEKEMDFADAPFGISALETAVSLALDRLVHRRVIGIGQLVQLMSTSPAKIMGLPGGSLEEGAVADITLLNLGMRVSVDPKTFLSKGKNTPFTGMNLRGAPAATIVGGKVVWKR